MAIFGGESKEEKRQRKEAEVQAKQEEQDMKVLSKYGLQDLSDPRDIESIRTIINELRGTGLMRASDAFGAMSEKDMLRVQMAYQKAIMEQNFVIIRLLNKIANK